ncbi:MAG: helix-turn-helix transcriptional regulator [Deltaproteobacteria bacterium]|nr:helix-turn-helix transcriptional regulator [Deltaproteobacteria bacterium]MCL4874965.1 PadR family transcriptional regulator [bacterium]
MKNKAVKAPRASKDNNHGILRDFFLGFIKIHTLHHAMKEDVYGLWLIEELNEHGYDLSPGTLYPILHKLEEDGLLTSYSEVVEGKVRKYYQTTPKGAHALERLREKIIELVKEVV